VITRIEARNFKCLKYVDVRLRPFQVLVGPEREWEELAVRGAAIPFAAHQKRASGSARRAIA
jgi:hypothetical protein